MRPRVGREVRVALATYAKLPELNDDDRLLLTALRAAGAGAEPAVWDAPRDWAEFDLVVVRTCWDYHTRLAEFLLWIERVAAAGAGLVNPASLLRWNADKRYLADLAALGVPVVPTAHLGPAGDAAEPAAAPSLAAVLRERGWRDAVVKPAVSASATDTWRTAVDCAEDDQRRFAALLGRAPRGVLVQQFVPEVVERGEWSLVYLGGGFSHAVRKRSAAGDFRVQSELGGRWERDVPGDSLVENGRAVLAAAAQAVGVESGDLAYARVDGVERGGRLLLMELECVEPYLFLATAPGAAERLASLVLSASEPGSAEGLTPYDPQRAPRARTAE